MTEAEKDLLDGLLSHDHRWVNFDPDFLRGETARFRRNGWIEERGKPPYREYRMTDKGHAALKERSNES